MPPTLHPDFTMTKLGVILIFIGTFWLHLSKRLAERQADEDTTANPREKKRAEPLQVGKPRLPNEDSLPRRMAGNGNSGLVGKILLVAGVLLYLGGLLGLF